MAVLLLLLLPVVAGVLAGNGCASDIWFYPVNYHGCYPVRVQNNCSEGMLSGRYFTLYECENARHRSEGERLIADLDVPLPCHGYKGPAHETRCQTDYMILPKENFTVCPVSTVCVPNRNLGLKGLSHCCDPAKMATLLRITSGFCSNWKKAVEVKDGVFGGKGCNDEFCPPGTVCEEVPEGGFFYNRYLAICCPKS